LNEKNNDFIYSKQMERIHDYKKTILGSKARNVDQSTTWPPISVKKWCPFLIGKRYTTSPAQTPSTLEDPDEGKNSKGKGGPMDKRARLLVLKDGPKSPGDGNGTGEISFWGRERIGRGSAFQEEAGKKEWN
jgi:hypothetical protein